MLPTFLFSHHALVLLPGGWRDHAAEKARTDVVGRAGGQNLAGARDLGACIYLKCTTNHVKEKGSRHSTVEA
jgi:hypothetical protein